VDDRFGFSLLNRVLATGEIWLAVAYLACMITVIAFRPQQIASAALFRMSYILFALYLIVPSLVDAIILMSLDKAGSSRSQPWMETTIISSMFSVFGKMLFAMSVICALSCFRIGGSARGARGNDREEEAKRESTQPPGQA
jgi:hypothetical protein